MIELQRLTAPFEEPLALNLQVGFRVIGIYQRTGTARVMLLKDLG